MSPDERRKARFQTDLAEITARNVFLYIPGRPDSRRGVCVELGLVYMHRLATRRWRLIAGLQTDCRAAFIGARFNPMMRFFCDQIVETREALRQVLAIYSANGSIKPSPLPASGRGLGD